MCGLFGIVQQQPLSGTERDRAHSARDVMTHRGPDHGGSWIEEGVYIGHRRLSVIDTTPAGNQPMEADGVVIAVNGEIYNFGSLRAELERSGHVFRSDSDSEVVLHGYRCWGPADLAAKMEGMYAAVIYDRQKRLLFALRDRVGIKPLYYYFDGETFLWASELKAVVSYLGRDRLEIDNSALVDFLACRHIPAPKSVYRNVFKVRPAEIVSLEIPLGRLSTRLYWRLPVDEVDAPDEELAAGLVSLLRESVHEQMVSDVPLGLLLSGGIDSSAVAALAAERGELLSFSIGLSDPDRDETAYARSAALHSGTRHHVHYLDPREMEDFPNRMANWFDEPFSNNSAVPTYRVCAFARDQVTVALSGDGGDELFGGYRWYASYARARRVQAWWPLKSTHGLRLPPVPRQRALEMLTIRDPVEMYARLRGSLSETRLREWKKRLDVAADYDAYWAYRQHYHPDLPPRKAAQVMDFHTYLPGEMLTKVDRMSMAVSLECRPPLLSTDLVEFAFSLPESFLYREGRLKGGFRFALRKLLPATILERGKQGFSVPDSGWRRQLISTYGSLQEAILERFVACS